MLFQLSNKFQTPNTSKIRPTRGRTCYAFLKTRRLAPEAEYKHLNDVWISDLVCLSFEGLCLFQDGCLRMRSENVLARSIIVQLSTLTTV